MPRRRSVLACVTRRAASSTAHADSRAPCGLVAWPATPSQALASGVMTGSLLRPWSILDGRQRPIAQRPLHAALNRLMVDLSDALPHRTERRILRDRPTASAPAIPGSPARFFATAKEPSIFPISSFVIANSTARRHPAMMPLLVSPTAKQGIRHQTIGSMMQVSWNRSSSAPRRAFCFNASCERWRNSDSSSSLIVPFIPSNSRSLGCRGS